MTDHLATPAATPAPVDDDATDVAPTDVAARRRERIAGTAVVLGGTAAVLFLNLGTIPPWVTLGQLVIVVIAIGGALEGARLWRRGVLRREASRRVSKEIAAYGGGLYGAIALATFVWLNALDLFGDIVAAGSFPAFLRGITVPWLIGEAVEAFVFGIRSLIWPWHWFSGQAALIALGVVALIDGTRGTLAKRRARTA